VAGDAKLSRRERDAIASPDTIVHVSSASIWEISIKKALGRLEIDEAELDAEIAANGFVELPIAFRHARAAGSLPRHHDDPFDRMLIAQSRLETLELVTRDGVFGEYDVPIFGK
jgi:PIN domain nuclease of toxin-antitoxin system